MLSQLLNLNYMNHDKSQNPHRINFCHGASSLLLNGLIHPQYLTDVHREKTTNTVALRNEKYITNFHIQLGKFRENF